MLCCDLCQAPLERFASDTYWLRTEIPWPLDLCPGCAAKLAGDIVPFSSGSTEEAPSAAYRYRDRAPGAA